MRPTSLDLSGLSARARRNIAFGVRGADGDDPNAELAALLARTEGLADLADDDLAPLAADLRAAADAALTAAVESGDPAAIDAALAQVETVTTALGLIETATTERETAAADLAARVEAARASLHVVDDAEGETEGEETEAAGEESTEGAETEGEEAEGETEATAPESVAAAATVPAVVSRVAARRPAAHAPRATPKVNPAMQLVASANAPGVPAGTVLMRGEEIDPDAICNLFEGALRAAAGYRGNDVTNLSLMSLGAFRPEEIYGRERTLGRDAIENDARIQAVTSRSALAASGGICAPIPVTYDFPLLGTDARPVRDGLARFGADRGGVRLLPPVTMAQTSAGVAAWTEANDENPSNPTTKPCVVMDCPSETQTLVDAITHCMTVGNFRARFFPEQVAAWVQQMAVWTARFAETRMLTEIGSGSTQINTGQIYGTAREVIGNVIRSASAFRNRYRLDGDFPLRMIAPRWLLDNMITDLTREAPGASRDRLLTDEAYINSLFAPQHINVSWTLDGESGQIFGAQAAGDLLGWPSTVVVYLFQEGSWLFLDGGTLDLGIVRDSTLNLVNNFQMFGETFENVAFCGYESQRITMDICPDGSTGTVSASSPCTTGS